MSELLMRNVLEMLFKKFKLALKNVLLNVSFPERPHFLIMEVMSSVMLLNVLSVVLSII